MIASRFISRCIRAVPRVLPKILTVASVAGVVATGVLSARGQFKADIILADHAADRKYMSKGEVFGSVWRCYAPAVIVGTGTCAAIVAAEFLNVRHIAAISGAAAALSNSYSAYKKAVKETVDAETQKKIDEALANQIIEVPDDAGAHVDGMYEPFVDDLPVSGNDTLFYESFSKRFFRSTIQKVQNAEYHINRNYILRGIVTMNELYSFLGLDETDPGFNLGWTDEIGIDFGYSWIDFEHASARTKAGTPYYIIRYPFEPCFIP